MVTELINNGRINDAIAQLKEWAMKYPGEGFSDRLEAIATDFRYMSDFMLQGMKDESRGDLYAAMQQKLRDIDYDLEVRRTIWERPEVSSYKKIFTHPDCSAEMLQSIMLEETDAKEHFIRLTNTFMVLYASLHWKDSDAIEWAAFLSNKNVSPIDAATLVSAITLSVLEHYQRSKVEGQRSEVEDPKVRCLKEVYRKSPSEMVRQRALVGLVMIGEELSIEAHIQMLACANADKDSNEIRQNIMPNLIKNQPFKMVNGQWKMDDDDNLNKGEYDPDADKREEESIEAMEESVNKMLKMQKKGSDIFFEGFSQMKRFPFFNKMVNWFIPYYPEHPDIENIMQNIGKSSFIDVVMKRGPFCESDKYSFIIAMSSVLQQLPENVRKMMESGDMGPIGMRGEDADLSDPAFIRLQYLQDMYRFMRLNNIGKMLYNPFNNLDEILEGFIKKATQQEEVAKEYTEHISKGHTEYTEHTEYTTLYAYYANWKLKKSDYDTALKYYTRCLKQRPQSPSIMRGLARAYYGAGDYEKSASYFDALITINPDNLNNRLNYAKAMTKAGKTEEVLNDLYKLEYENPGNDVIQDTLGWALLYAGKASEAEQYCHDVMAHAYALIINNKAKDAIELLKGYTMQQVEENMEADAQLLHQYGIGEAEKAIILSAIQQSNVP
ncbi:MAG: tetratricopeptide repeat protein [Prevotella sp.]|nr:tetratricopeptide repeat protein [Prevotella sp.]